MKPEYRVHVQGRVVTSTNDFAVAIDEAERWGADAISRPGVLADGSDTCWWKRAGWVRVEAVPQHQEGERMSAPLFPIHKGTHYSAQSEAVPWSVMEIVAEDAQHEHAQSLATLAARGGLTWDEIGHLFVRHFAREQGGHQRSAYADFQLARRTPEGTEG